MNEDDSCILSLVIIIDIFTPCDSHLSKYNRITVISSQFFLFAPSLVTKRCIL